MTVTAAWSTTPLLPEPRGDLSAALVSAFRGGPEEARLPIGDRADPYSEDLHLSLHMCYELHYHGFEGVGSGWEWDPDLLRLRASLELCFLSALREEVPGGTELDAELDALLVDPIDGSGVSGYLVSAGQWWQMREYFVHRSIYHLKEADPYAWVIPRLSGQAKAALVAVEFDEYGAGRAERLHAQLFADLMAGAGLDNRYLRYLDDVPAPILALVNMMSLFGLHREWRGALVGHFASMEITSSPSAQRMVTALRQLDADPRCVRFFTEHVEADAVHEQVMRREVIGDLLAREPELTASMVFGIQVTDLLERRFADHVLRYWQSERSSLSRGTGPDSAV
jgi:hypothetical protein